MEELAQAWSLRLEKDLVGFADRHVPVVVESEGTTLRAEWEARGKSRSELFGLNREGVLRWVSGPAGDASYGSFLTSDRMADFGQLAAAINRAIEPAPNFVASQAIIDDGFSPSSVTATPAAAAQIADQGRQQAEGRTSLYFVKGGPGAGKTTLLREMTTSQAQRYASGESDFLFFYVSAQGRELSNLRDAFSGELQDLRAGFTRDAIAALARAGLLIPIVDGFDELLGTAGYSGAFGSLQSLLADLQGLGALVVSARSSFYDVEFLGRSASPVTQADISITAVELEPWTEEQLSQYLRRDQPAEETEREREVLSRLESGDRELLRRPFFASQFPGYARAVVDGAPASSLLDYLIRAYIEREAEKIVDSEGDPVLPVDGHHRLFELAASEMWDGEARVLSGDDLRTLTEVVAEEFELGGDEAAQLGTKVTSYAGFRAGSGSARDDFAFEHEVYFDYFLARAVRRFIEEDRADDLLLFLDRGVVPDSVAVEAISTITETDSPPPSLLRCSVGVRYANRRRNLGTLVATFAREKAPIQSCELQNLEFVDTAVGPGHFKEVVFSGCLFFGADLSGTVFEACDADGSTFQGIRLSNRSRLGLRGLRAGQNVGSVSHSEVQDGDVYAPQDVQEVLERLGAPSAAPQVQSKRYSAEADVLIKLLQQVARAYRRTNILFENDERLRRLFDQPLWPKLKRLLVDHGIVTEEVRQASGPRGVALRLRVGVDKLLVGQTAANLPADAAGDLWRALRTL